VNKKTKSISVKKKKTGGDHDLAISKLIFSVNPSLSVGIN